MSDNEAASPIAPGSLAVFPLDTFMVGGGAPTLSGLMVMADGRLVLANTGQGLAVRLSAEDASGLALLLWQLAPHLAATRAEAVDAVDLAMARILSERAAGNA